MMILFSRVISRISGTPRKTLFGSSQHCQSLVFSNSCHSSTDSNPKPKGDAVLQEKVDPFSLVADEISLVSNRLHSSAVAKVPELAAATGYFFREGVEGKRTCPMVLLLMATAVDMHRPKSPFNCIGDALKIELRRRQQLIAELTEMIHVASLIHDDILDDADTRRGVGSLNFVFGNKLAVLAGNFLLFRALGALASLKNTEAVSLLVTAMDDIVVGQTMQMTATIEQHCSMDFYMQKTYYKSATLLSNSCKAIALLSDQTPAVAKLAFEYGKHLGLAYQFIDDILDFTGTSASLGKPSLTDIRQGVITAPILFATEEFPQLRAVIEQGFDHPANVETALEYLWRSQGIRRTKELATKRANLAAAAIDSLPKSGNMDVRKSRQALINLTQVLISRNK